jgi:hypothetical protein
LILRDPDVVCVPDPASATLLAFGLGMIGVMRRRAA